MFGGIGTALGIRVWVYWLSRWWKVKAEKNKINYLIFYLPAEMYALGIQRLCSVVVMSSIWISALCTALHCTENEMGVPKISISCFRYFSLYLIHQPGVQLVKRTELATTCAWLWPDAWLCLFYINYKLSALLLGKCNHKFHNVVYRSTTFKFCRTLRPRHPQFNTQNGLTTILATTNANTSKLWIISNNQTKASWDFCATFHFISLP